MSAQPKVGRFGYEPVGANPPHITFIDFDRLSVDLNTGFVELERNGASTALSLLEIQSMFIGVAGKTTQRYPWSSIK